MSVDKYLFWNKIQQVVDNIDKVEEHKKSNWSQNLTFVEDLNKDLEIFNKLLGGK